MKKYILGLLISTTIGGGLSAQQLPVSNLYDQNRMIFNPANTGDQDKAVGMLHHRQQWLGLQGAPANQILTLHSPIGDYTSVGGMVQNQYTDVIRRTSIHLNYAYGVDVALGHRINFGLGAGYYQNSIDLQNIVVQDPSELSMYAGSLNGATGNFDFGIRYNWDELEVGVSANQLLNNRLNSLAQSDDRFNQFRTHFNGIASYGYAIESIDLIVKPTVLVRYIPESGTLNDYMVNLDWKNLVWGNLGYRDGMNFIFSAGTWLTNRMRINYSYNYSSTLLSLESYGTHEIAIGIDFGKMEDAEGGPFETNKRTGELTEREKALMEQREAKKEEKAAKQARKEEENKRGKKTIKIETDGFDPDSDEEIIIKPGGGDGKSTPELQEMKSEMDLINSKLDQLLEQDVSTEANRDQVEDEILKLRMQLVNLLEDNDPDNVHEVSGEIERIQEKIKELRKKIE